MGRWQQVGIERRVRRGDSGGRLGRERREGGRRWRGEGKVVEGRIEGGRR
jgi:hypothetical protein